MNPYVVLAAIIVFAVSHIGAYSFGRHVEGTAQELKQAKQREMDRKVADAIHDSVADLSVALGIDLQKALKGIRITNTTINNDIQHEKEMHYVLTNPDCAVPPSTVRVRNKHRDDPDTNRSAGSGDVGKMPAPPEAPRGQALASGR